MPPVTHCKVSRRDEGQVLTQHFVAGHVDAGHSEGRVRVRRIVVDGELPVVDAAGESHRAEGHPVFPALNAHGGVVFAKD